MKLLENKVAIVTGGSRGIGAAIVKKFVENGANVAFTYRSSAGKANALAEELSKDGNIVKAYQSDASSFGDCKELVKNVLADFGKRIDVVVNNAGITKDTLLLRMSEEQSPIASVKCFPNSDFVFCVVFRLLKILPSDSNSR